jgi:hypothetical protein
MIEKKLSYDQIIYEEESVCDSSFDEPCSHTCTEEIPNSSNKSKAKNTLPIVEDINITEK